MYIKPKLKIREFAQLCNVTVRTLRHYEQIGLLTPHEVDTYTGYRYYHVSQFQTMSSILRLKDLGFTLDEILDYFASGTLTPNIKALESKIDLCNQQLNELKRRHETLLNMVDSQNKILNMEKFTIKPLPEIIVASHREVIKNYSALGPLCCNVIGPEMARLGCKCPQPGYCFTFEHDTEYRPTDIDIEYCEQVESIGQDSSIIQFKVIPAVEKAVCLKHVGPYETIRLSYVEIFQYIEQQGLNVDGHPRCVYIDGAWNQDDPEKWVSIIQVPVK